MSKINEWLPDFRSLKKSSKNSSPDFKSVRLAILGDSSTQLLVQAIKGYWFEHSINYEIFEADYNQIDRMVFDPGSELYEFKP